MAMAIATPFAQGAPSSVSAAISGHVTDATSAPVSNYTVVVFPTDRTKWSVTPRLLRLARPATTLGLARLPRAAVRPIDTEWAHESSSRTPLGDQAQFASRAAYDALGGFRSWPILEDLDFAWRLRRLGKPAILRGPAVTGARRFLQRGVLRTVSTNWLIWALYFCGVGPARLARLYRNIR